jgi:predicted nucleotidyltransferase
MSPDLSRLPDLGAPREATGALAGFLEAAQAALPVVGVYLYGSLARGAYRPPASDVDLLVVASASTPDSAMPKLRAAQMLARSGARIDVIVATSGQLATSVLPVPLDLVLPPDAEPERHPENRGMMFPLDRHDAWECGVCLSGPPAREVVHPVSRELLFASLVWAFPHFAHHFKNPELMLCRATHVFLEGGLCAKPEAGRWALKVFDPRWHELIRAALSARENGRTQGECSPEELAGFQRACAALIEKETGEKV